MRYRTTRTGAIDSQHGLRAVNPGVCSGAPKAAAVGGGRIGGVCGENGTGSRHACQSTESPRTKWHGDGRARLKPRHTQTSMRTLLARKTTDATKQRW